MKYIENIASKTMQFSEEAKLLYKYLLDYDLLVNKIFKKIYEESLNKEEFEILLYSLRFIFNTKINSNNNNFYNNLLAKNVLNLLINVIKRILEYFSINMNIMN